MDANTEGNLWAGLTLLAVLVIFGLILWTLSGGA